MKRKIESIIGGIIVSGVILLFLFIIGLAIKEAWRILIVIFLGAFSVFSGAGTLYSGGIRKLVLEKDKINLLIIVFSFLPIIFAFRCGVGFNPVTSYYSLQLLFAIDPFLCLMYYFDSDFSIVLPKYKKIAIKIFSAFGVLCGIRLILTVFNAPFSVPKQLWQVLDIFYSVIKLILII